MLAKSLFGMVGGTGIEIDSQRIELASIVRSVVWCYPHLYPLAWAVGGHTII